MRSGGGGLYAKGLIYLFIYLFIYFQGGSLSQFYGIFENITERNFWYLFIS